MSISNITIQVCGGAGDGTIVAGMLIAKSLVKIGYHVFIHDIFPPEIRGFGKTISEVRVSTEKVSSQSDSVDVLLGLNNPFAIEQIDDLCSTGIIIFDSKPGIVFEESESVSHHAKQGMPCYGIPMEASAQKIVGTNLGKNIVAIGFLIHLLDLNPDIFVETIKEIFAKKGEKRVLNNIELFNHGLNLKHDFQKRPLTPPSQHGKSRTVITGNDALSLGAINAELKFFAGYPITPASKIMEKLAVDLPEHGGVVLQAEDEISSAGAVLGSWFTGKRAMTATSGPGFSLMTELINLAVMSETPFVVVNVMRGGPSTGLPTKTEQSDLNLVLYGGHGDSPRVVLAPATIGECYHIIQDALDVAEQYQTPVVVLSDRFLAMSYMDVPDETLQRVRKSTRKKYDGHPDHYKRYQITESGVSPWVLPGELAVSYTATGLEHNEDGQPNFAPDIHKEMTDKRYRKFDHMLDSLPKPEFFGDENAPNLIITWGSSFSAVAEAIERLQTQGYKARVVKMKTIFPQHEEVMRTALGKAKKVIVPEQNKSAQLARIIKGYYGIDADEVRLPGGASIRPHEAEELLKGRLFK